MLLVVEPIFDRTGAKELEVSATLEGGGDNMPAEDAEHRHIVDSTETGGRGPGGGLP